MSFSACIHTNIFLKKPEYDQNMTTLLVTENKAGTETVIGKNVLTAYIDFFFSSLSQLISLSGLQFMTFTVAHHQKPFGFTFGEFFYHPS